MPKQFWKSKAFWLGILTILGGVGEFLSGLPAGASISTVLIGVIQIILRFYTNTPISGTPGAKPKGR